MLASGCCCSIGSSRRSRPSRSLTPVVVVAVFGGGDGRRRPTVAGAGARGAGSWRRPRSGERLCNGDARGGGRG